MKLKGRRYIKSPRIAGELAEKLDPQQATQHSNTLRQFIEVLKDL